MPANKDGSLCKSVQKPGVELKPKQAERLLSLINSRSTYGAGLAKCFIPHHGFVFYDASGKMTAQISICFMCDRLEASPDVPAMGSDVQTMVFSKRGKAQLIQLCHDLGLPGCPKPGK